MSQPIARIHYAQGSSAAAPPSAPRAATELGVRQLLRTAHALHRHGRATPEEIRAWQDLHLRRLLVHAYEQVPFYRRLFDRHRLHPRHVRGVVDLALIPVVSRHELESRPVADLLIRGLDPARLLSFPLGDSTVEFVVRRTRLEQSFAALFRRRAYEEFGLKLWDRIGMVGSTHMPWMADGGLVERSLRMLGVHHAMSLDGGEDPDRTIEELARFQPHLLVAPPKLLATMAARLLASGRRDLRPRLVVTGGELLTDAVRTRVSEGFGVAPLQTYGTGEFPLLGWECRASGEIHTSDDGFIVEVLRDGRPAQPGENGEIVVTGLHAYAMPLIRYRLQHTGTRASLRCRCGRPFATLRGIQGSPIGG